MVSFSLSFLSLALSLSLSLSLSLALSLSLLSPAYNLSRPLGRGSSRGEHPHSQRRGSRTLSISLLSPTYNLSHSLSLFSSFFLLYVSLFFYVFLSLMMYSREQVAASLYVIYMHHHHKGLGRQARCEPAHASLGPRPAQKAERESRSKRRARDGKHTMGA